MSFSEIISMRVRLNIILHSEKKKKQLWLTYYLFFSPKNKKNQKTKILYGNIDSITFFPLFKGEAVAMKNSLKFS